MSLRMLAEPVSDAPLSARLEDAVAVLRRRLEQHLEQEAHLRRSLDRVQQGWSSQSDQISRQMSMLEAHLSTWSRNWADRPQLSVVAAD